MGHRNIKRTFHRVKEELHSTMIIIKTLGFKKGWTTLLGKIDIQLIARNGGIEKARYRKHLIKKHEAMNAYFFKKFPFNSQFLKQDNDNKINEQYKECIWLCWWQGLNNAPEIVKKCVESIKRNAGNHKVIVITKENVNDFATFPTWLIEKYKKGIILKAHLSDILRLQLLSLYGGIWLDATFYCTGSLEKYFSFPIWSIKRPGYRYTSVAAGNFANYSLGCTSENRHIFNALYEYLLNYWKKYNFMIDYLFLDYLIVQAQKANEEINNAFKKIESNNPQCDELLKLFAKKYDDKLWDKLKKDTDLFKLSYKRKNSSLFQNVGGGYYFL